MNKKTLFLVQAALVAALYAGATYISTVFGIAYGPIQFRLSEALTVLAVLFPFAVPGLTVGCALGNLASPMGIWDIVFGSLATLLATLCARKLRNIRFKSLPLLSILMPVLFNAVIIGAEIAFLMPSGETILTAFAVNAAEVGAGELTVCLVCGIPVYYGMKKALGTPVH